MRREEDALQPSEYILVILARQVMAQCLQLFARTEWIICVRSDDKDERTLAVVGQSLDFPHPVTDTPSSRFRGLERYNVHSVRGQEELQERLGRPITDTSSSARRHLVCWQIHICC